MSNDYCVHRIAKNPMNRWYSDRLNLNDEGIRTRREIIAENLNKVEADQLEEEMNKNLIEEAKDQVKQSVVIVWLGLDRIRLNIILERDKEKFISDVMERHKSQIIGIYPIGEGN